MILEGGKTSMVAKRARYDDDSGDYLISDAPAALHFDRQQDYCQLPKSLLLDTGLFASNLPETGVLLFLRKQFHDLVETLTTALSTRKEEEGSINPYTLPWILGSPGSGKSIGVLSFAWTLCRDLWAFSWIHIELGELTCLQVVGNQKRTLLCGEESDQRSRLGDFLGGLNNDRQHVVFLDGFVNDDLVCTASYRTCRKWVIKSPENRRLVVVCSMASRGKHPEADDMQMNSEEFLLDAWTEEDYSKAVQDEEFFQSVRLKLDATDADCPKDELVASKLYFAGGSCRYMFQYSTAAVIKSLSRALMSVDDIVPYLANTAGQLSKSVANCLICCYNQPRKRMYNTRIVSRYAATEFAIMQGPKLIDRLADFLIEVENRAMDGWMFELRFFSSVSHEDVVVHLSDGSTETWMKSDVMYFHPSRIEVVPDGPIWWRPNMWNQGGYDALFLNKDIGKVRFVQLTISSRHSFKIDEFYKLLTQLKEQMEIKVLEIFCLSSEDMDLQISPIVGEGLLTTFGWEKGKERDKVTKGWLRGPPTRRTQ